MAAAGPKTRKLPCWIESFEVTTAGLPSPDIFRRWSAISAIAATLERRVYVSTSMSVVYPNMFVLLVAPPGVGKSVGIKHASDLVMRTNKIAMAPEDVTKASLIDAMQEAKKIFTVPPKIMLEYHSLFVSADELGVLLPSHDLAFLNTLNVLYDNRPRYKETRRHREKDLILEAPQINILAGTQPDYMGTLLPAEAWGMGFMTRIMMIYHGKPSKPKLFGPKGVKLDTKDLLHDLNMVAELHGEFTWHPDAEAELTEWYGRDLEPVPTHSKLKHYVARRVLHVLKLSMISSAARRNDLVIEVEDVDRARAWLLEAEALMPEVFKDMGGSSDKQVIEDLHYYLWEIWAKTKAPIHRSRIDTFLMARTPAYNAENIVRLCVGAKILIDKGGDLFEPGEKNQDQYS